MDNLSGMRQCFILKIMVNWESGGLCFISVLLLPCSFDFLKIRWGNLHQVNEIEILTEFKQTQWPQMWLRTFSKLMRARELREHLVQVWVREIITKIVNLQMEVSGGRMLEGIRMENSRDFSDLLQKSSSLKKIMNEMFLDQLKLEAV